MTRSLTSAEIRVITQVAEQLPNDQRQRLLDDLGQASAAPATDDGARVLFEISGYRRPPYRGQRSFGVEGELLDSDGTKLTFELYADENGHLLELELIRWGEGNLICPNWNTINLYSGAK